jgi:hypothetical protein
LAVPANWRRFCAAEPDWQIMQEFIDADKGKDSAYIAKKVEEK